MQGTQFLKPQYVILMWSLFSNLTPMHLGVGAKRHVHWFLEGKGLGIQQATSVWVGSPKSAFGWVLSTSTSGYRNDKLS